MRKHGTTVRFILAKANGRVRFERVGVEHITNECNTIGWRSARKTVGESRDSSLYRISNSICPPFRTLANFPTFPIILLEEKILLLNIYICIIEREKILRLERQNIFE